MKKLKILILILSPHLLFAMPCPNGQHVLYKGDLLDNVIKQCGKPDSENQYTKNIPIQEQWVYYIPDRNKKTNTKMTILFNRDDVVNINLVESEQRRCSTVSDENGARTTCNNTEKNLTSTSICGYPINVNNNQKAVMAACGNPLTKQVLQSVTISIIELNYLQPKPQTIIFEDGKLADWK